MAKDEVTRVLDSLLQATGASCQDYGSGVVLQHCDNGFGGYDGWQGYAEGTFERQSRDSAIAMADTLSAYLRRSDTRISSRRAMLTRSGWRA